MSQLKKRPRHHDDAERTLALHERMVYCHNATLHTLLLENEGRSDFDINACLPLQPPGSKRATPDERIRMMHTTLLYHAVVLEDTERVALLLLFGADPHAVAYSMMMVTLNTKTAIDLAHVRSNGLIIIRALLYDTNTRNGGSSAAAVDAALVETARSSLQFSLMWLLEGRGARLQSPVLIAALNALNQQHFSWEALNIVHRLTGLYKQDTTPYIDMFPHAMALLEGPRHGPHALHNTLSMPGVMPRA
jgi:hypothetical protein